MHAVHREKFTLPEGDQRPQQEYREYVFFCCVTQQPSWPSLPAGVDTALLTESLNFKTNCGLKTKGNKK